MHEIIDRFTCGRCKIVLELVRVNNCDELIPESWRCITGIPDCWDKVIISEDYKDFSHESYLCEECFNELKSSFKKFLISFWNQDKHNQIIIQRD